MSDKVYFCGFREEHFNGWNGVGQPSYTRVSASDAGSFNKVGYIILGTPGNVCWKDIDVDAGDLYLSYYFYSGDNSASNLNLIDENNNLINIVFSTSGINVNIGTYNPSTHAMTVSNVITKTGVSLYTNLYFHLYYDSDTEMYYDIDVSYTNAVPTSSFKSSTIADTKISNIGKIKSIFSSFVQSNSNLYHLTCANFNLNNSYLDYSVASGIGVQSGWAGSTSLFSTYPVSISQTDINNNSGVYSITPNQSVSYTLSKTLNTSIIGFSPKTVIISSPMISSTSSDDSITPNVVPYIYKKYTNGYSGSYNISIPNYLESGTGISIVFFLNTTSSDLLFNFPNNSSTDPCPKIILNMASTGIATSNYVTYQQYNNGTYTPIYNNTSILIQNSWNQLTIFNDNGTLNFNVNGSTFSGSLNQPMIDYTSSFYINQGVIIGGISYINDSSQPTYPFDKSSNVVSYIDFENPLAPTIHGDISQFSITSSSISTITATSTVPSIDITSIDYTGFSQTVTETGENHMFLLCNNPVTGNRWQSSDIQSYQFGITKIS